ncbi:MAG: hypothetical protein AAF628_33060 [Planctomycetota bacterium]
MAYDAARDRVVMFGGRDRFGREVYVQAAIPDAASPAGIVTSNGLRFSIAADPLRTRRGQ